MLRFWIFTWSYVINGSCLSSMLEQLNWAAFIGQQIVEGLHANRFVQPMNRRFIWGHDCFWNAFAHFSRPTADNSTQTLQSLWYLTYTWNLGLVIICLWISRKSSSTCLALLRFGGPYTKVHSKWEHALHCKSHQCLIFTYIYDHIYLAMARLMHI